MVKQGYKQTEIGVIPEDWEIRLLGNVIDIYRGGSPRPIQDYITNKSNGINWIKIGDTSSSGKYITTANEKIIPEGEKNSRKVFVGDFLLSNSMSFGRPYILKIEGCIHDGWLVLQNYKETFNTEFLYYLLTSKCILDQYLSKAAGSSVLNLNKELVSSVNVFIPPLAEQEAIATALSDADTWIEHLKQLIAKKRLIKQGAMQELLTPKEDWEEQSIISICDNIIDYRGVTPKKLGMEWGDGDIVALSAGNVKKGYIDFNADCYLGSEVLYKRWMRNGDPKKGNIVFTLEAPLGNIALIPDDKKYILSQRTILLQLNQKYSSKYIFQLMLSSKFQNFISESATGSTAQGIKRQTFEKLIIHVPSLSEQERIATILSDMDAELEALEKQLGKAQQIKQGMMQELLTGRIRLV